MSLNAIDKLTQLTSFETTAPKNAPPNVEPAPSGSLRNHLQKVETQQAPEASSAQSPSSKSTDEPTSTDNQKAVARDSDDSQSDENATDGAERDGSIETDASDSSATSAGPENEDDSNDVVELDEQAILEAQAIALATENLGQQTDSQNDDGQGVKAETEDPDIKESPDARKATLKQIVTSQQEPTPDGKETAQQNEIQEPIKPKPPQEKQLTLSELTQGFLDHLKQQKEPYTMATQSNKQGAPSAEQLMYERYLQKIIQCIVKSYQTCTSKPSNSTQPQEGIIRLSIKRDGSINALYVVESSGNRSVDAFALSLFRDASSSFPPAPERLQGNHHTVDFIFSDLRMFGSIMGWGLRSK